MLLLDKIANPPDWLGYSDIKLIKEQYPALKMWSDGPAYHIYESIQEEQVLTEFLKTVSLDKTAKQVVSRFERFVEEIIKIPDGLIKITIFNFDKNDLDSLNKLLETFGWDPVQLFIGREGGRYSANIKGILDNIDRVHQLGIVYEPRYTREIDVKGGKLYHITTDIAWDKIEFLGLTPKNQNKKSDHPSRIYLLNINRDEALAEFKGFATQLLQSYKEAYRVKEMCLLEIDASKLTRHEFYEDPNTQDAKGVWTERNIHPVAIKLIHKIESKELK